MATPGMRVGRSQRDPRAGWLAFALVAMGAFVIVAVLAISFPAFDDLDAALSAAIRSMRSPALTQLALLFTWLGSSMVTATVTIALMAWMAWRRNWAAVVYVFMTIPVGWFLGNEIIKNVIARPRPQGVAIVPMPADFSMPSGHALASFLWLTTLCVIVMLNAPTGRHLKRWLAIGSAVLIVGVGWSRVYLGVHWTGDVLAAWLFGFAWWSFTTATYFGSITEEKRVAPRPGGSETASE
jgi:membrane-associated phospholipid phosphatase